MVRQRLGCRIPGPSSTLNGLTSKMRFVPPECLLPIEVAQSCIPPEVLSDA